MEKIVSWRPHDVGMDRTCLTTKGILQKYSEMRKNGRALQESCLRIFLGHKCRVVVLMLGSREF